MEGRSERKSIQYTRFLSRPPKEGKRSNRENRAEPGRLQSSQSGGK